MPVITIGLNTGDDYSGLIDNAMSSSFPNGGDPNNVEIQIVGSGSAPVWQGIYKPNIAAASSVLTGATINGAGLFLKRSGGFIGATMTMHARRIIPSWTEADVDWNTRDGSTSWNTAGAQGNGTDRDSSDMATCTLSDTTDEVVDLTGTGMATYAANVNSGSATNNGFTGFTPEGADWRHHTGQASDGDRPSFWIDYTAGSAPQTVSPSSISSPAAYGSHTIANAAAQTISPGGIASPRVFGSPTVANAAAQTISPGGVASPNAFGSHTISLASNTILPSGIGSPSAFGSHTVTDVDTNFTLEPSGVASPRAFGSHLLTEDVVSEGIPSPRAFGTLTIVQEGGPETIIPSGIDSLRAFGSHTVVDVDTNFTLEPGGIASPSAFGSHTLSQAPTGLVSPSGIAGEKAAGSPTVVKVLQGLLMNGGPSTKGTGLPRIIGGVPQESGDKGRALRRRNSQPYLR